ncbi:MAG: iron-sulfur cluster assembly scaffold protein [Leptospiraceae bacterium]|nr:iron-sulfur cluster assembly scaffold protein [Leptospiraceae bacterium]MCP5499432.1 iron-sulfur cluster assembly scaffold protein [Leptospiraceae bacterium]
MSLESKLYSDSLLDIYKNLVYRKAMESYTHFSSKKNQLCGDEITVYFTLLENRIIDASFQAEACMLCTVSGEILCRESIGKTFKELNEISKNLKAYFSNRLELDLELSRFRALLTARPYLNRHRCVFLAWETIEEVFHT